MSNSTYYRTYSYLYIEQKAHEKNILDLIIVQTTHGKETFRTNYKRKAHGKDTRHIINRKLIIIY